VGFVMIVARTRPGSVLEPWDQKAQVFLVSIALSWWFPNTPIRCSMNCL
jgi:hypothetical protein